MDILDAIVRRPLRRKPHSLSTHLSTPESVSTLTSTVDDELNLDASTEPCIPKKKSSGSSACNPTSSSPKLQQTPQDPSIQKIQSTSLVNVAPLGKRSTSSPTPCVIPCIPTHRLPVLAEKKRSPAECNPVRFSSSKGDNVMTSGTRADCSAADKLDSVKNSSGSAFSTKRTELVVSSYDSRSLNASSPKSHRYVSSGATVDSNRMHNRVSRLPATSAKRTSDKVRSTWPSTSRSNQEAIALVPCAKAKIRQQTRHHEPAKRLSATQYRKVVSGVPQPTSTVHKPLGRALINIAASPCVGDRSGSGMPQMTTPRRRESTYVNLLSTARHTDPPSTMEASRKCRTEDLSYDCWDAEDLEFIDDGLISNGETHDWKAALRKITKYNPSRVADEDDEAKESSLVRQEYEEIRAASIAAAEDAREWRRLQLESRVRTNKRRKSNSMQ